MKMSYMTEKEYKGTFYGMRMENEKDKEIKRVLTNLSERKNIPVNRLIFAYLEKALNLNEKQEINIKKEELNEDFKNFFDKITKRVLGLENNLEMQFFEKRKALKRYVYNKYPDKIQRKIFYLKLIKTQIYCEMELLHSFFFLYDYKSNEFVGYARFACESVNIPLTFDNYNKKHNECLVNLYYRWFYELKTAGIILDLKDFKEIERIKDFDKKFNYNALEDFIFNELYKTQKILPSPKEKRIKGFKSKENGTTKNKSLKYLLKKLFRELVKYYNGFSNEILHSEESEYQLFYTIGYTPHIFYKNIDLDGYINFVEKHKLGRPLSDSLKNKTRLFTQLNKFYTFPPLNLITEIKLFFSYLKRTNKFLEKLPDLINQQAYSTSDLLKIYFYLIMLSIDQSDQQSYCKNLLNEIPNKNIDKLNEIMPKKYDSSLQLIKTQLKKQKIDLNSILVNAYDDINRKKKDDRMRYFNTYPEDMQKSMLDALKNSKKINEDLIPLKKN